jgi:hypothetical protein
METVEKISSFLTLLSLPILAPAMGRAFFDVYARRHHLLAYWADRLDELRRGGIVLPLRA